MLKRKNKGSELQIISVVGGSERGNAAGMLSTESRPFFDLQFSQAAFPYAAHHLFLLRHNEKYSAWEEQQTSLAKITQWQPVKIRKN